jgi:hypothetical protein
MAHPERIVLMGGGYRPCSDSGLCRPVDIPAVISLFRPLLSRRFPL